MTASSNSPRPRSDAALAHAAWLECGATRFEVRIASLAPEACELWADSCCCSRLRAGSAVALELPPPLSGAGLLRLAGRVSVREEAPASGSSPRERIRIEFAAFASPLRLALDAALPRDVATASSSLRRAA